MKNTADSAPVYPCDPRGSTTRKPGQEPQFIADLQGRVAKLLAAGKTDEEILSELYLTALCREPTQAERAHAAKFLKSIGDRRECFEDLLWVLLNSKQFKFVR